MEIIKIYRRPRGLVRVRAVLYCQPLEEPYFDIEIAKSYNSNRVFRKTIDKYKDYCQLTGAERLQAKREIAHKYLKDYELNEIKQELLNKLKKIMEL